MDSYCFFSNYYDEVVRWTWYSLEDEVDMLDDFIKKYSCDTKHRKTILETACWTWTIAWELLKRWYDIVWMDISEDMIDKAEDIIWENRCFVWDMTDFDLKKQFDVVLCNYNSICHLICFKDWRKFFLQSYEHLKTWGLLIFDINTIYEFESITRDYAQFFNFKDAETAKEDTVCLEMFKKELRDANILFSEHWKQYYYEWLIKMFVQNEKWTYDLIKEVVKENSFEIDKIIKELDSFWFKLLHLEDFHDWEVHAESERVYFIAKKV